MDKKILNEMSLKEFASISGDLVKNNLSLIDNGGIPLTFCLQGEAGIGKTQSLEAYAKANNMTLVKVMLSQMEEIGDLTGMPVIERLCTWTRKDGTIGKAWRSEKLLHTVPNNVTVTDTVRTSYAPPAWLPKEDNPNGVLVILDDYSRANSMFQQAIMEICNERKYISWELPKHSIIVMTSNPDNGKYNVSALDDAQTSRMLTFNIKFDLDSWTEWAEGKVDDRCINFALYAGDVLFKPQNHVLLANPRSYTNFCKAIAYYQNWENPATLVKILYMSKGAFPKDTDNRIGEMFTSFINLKMDKMMSPDAIINKPWEDVFKSLQESLYKHTDDGRTVLDKPIATVMTNRLLSYIRVWFNEGKPSKVIKNRLEQIITHTIQLFPEDAIYRLVNTIRLEYPKHTNNFLESAAIRTRLKISESCQN